VFEGSTLVSMVQAMLVSKYPARTTRSLASACDFIAPYAVDDDATH
jgi:hypothetical protein